MEPRRYSYGDGYGYFEPTRYLSLYDQPRYKGKKRAGFTTNKRQGTSKSRRRMAAKSRKMNRTK